MAVKFKKSDFGILIGQANLSSKKLIKTKWKGITFTRKEDIIHYEAVQHLKINYPDVIFQSNHMQGSYKKNLHNVGRLNGTRGLPDLIIFKPNKIYPFLSIEIKKPGGRLSIEELEVQKKFTVYGYLSVEIGSNAFNIETAIQNVIRVIDNYMNSK